MGETEELDDPATVEPRHSDIIQAAVSVGNDDGNDGDDHEYIYLYILSGEKNVKEG